MQPTPIDDKKMIGQKHNKWAFHAFFFVTYADSEEAYGSAVWIDGRQLGTFSRDGEWKAKP
ncbi:MAG: hypothetical protein WC003_16745 [Terrimicrobiaceae bacterium]